MASAAYGSLPFKEQIAFIRSKVSIPTAAWTDVYAAEHDHSLMVAGARGEVLTDLRGAIEGFIERGENITDFRKQFDDIVAKHGWAYNGGRNWRTHAIYDTNLRQSYHAGREAQMADPELRKSRPYGLYRHGGSSDPRPDHLSWDGLVLPLDNPWWDTYSPLNGWGCSCKKFTLSQRDVDRMGLKVAEQAPPVEWEEKVVGSRGPSPRTVRVPKGIDPGFEYAPGKSRIQSMTPRPIDGPPPTYHQPGTPRPSMPPVKPIKAKPLPQGATEAELAQSFLDEVGGIKGREAVLFTDVTGERVPLSAELFKDHRGRWKIKKEGRHGYLHILAETLKDPDEIWLAWQQVKSGNDVLRRRYVRVLPGSEDGIAVFEFGKGGWREITVFHVTDAIARQHGYADARGYIESQRVGLRVYARDESGS